MRRPVSIITMILAAACAGLGAQALRPMTIQDLLVAVRVGDPQLSPDGRTVLFTRTTTDPKTYKRNTDINSVSVAAAGAQASSPTALLATDKSENTPRWFPDGTRFAFISNRDGEPQVYSANAQGGDVKQLTNISGGVQAPLVISPDGSTIAYVADVYPECGDDACNKAKRAAADADPVKVHVLTRLLFRHWDEWREGVRHHVFVAPTNGSAPTAGRDVTPGDFDSPPGQQEDAAIQFSPDSKSLAFVSNRDGNDKEAWSTNNDVFIVPVIGGNARKATNNPGADAEPEFLKDGSLIVRAQRRAGFEADRWYLDVYDREFKNKRTVFMTPDLSVSEFTLSPDQQSILFTASSFGTDNLYRVPLASGTPQQIAKGGAISAVSHAGGSIVFSQASLVSPAEIFVTTGQGQASVRPLTTENAPWLRTVEMTPPESLTVPGAGGTPIQYWILKPPAFNPLRKYPVVFLIHGGPQGAWGDGWSARWNPSLWAAQGWVVVAPNPRGSTGFGQKFVDDISQDWGGKVMTDLTAVFDTVVKLPYIDANRQGIAGASYGGYAVNWLLGHTTRFKAAVTHDGVFNLDSMAMTTEELWFSEWEAGGVPWSPAGREFVAKWSPHLYVQAVKTPTLIITNELDFRVPVDQGLQMFTALRRNGTPAKALVFPDEGHWVLKPLNSKRWHEEVFAWIKTYLK